MIDLLSMTVDEGRTSKWCDFVSDVAQRACRSRDTQAVGLNLEDS